MTTQNIYSLTDTWNSAGTTFTGIGLSVTDTASASGSLLLDLQVGGSSIFNIGKTGTASTAPALSLLNATMWVPSGGALAFSSAGNTETWRSEGSLGIGFTSSALLWWSSAATGAYSQRDTILARDAANTLAQRNGTNAQAFRVYNTYTDASNYERGIFRWISNFLEIGTEAAGTGSARAILLSTGGATRWNIGTAGHLTAGVDNTYDIGAAAATRPRTIYAGTGFEGASSGYFRWASRSYVDSPADGVIRLLDNAGSSFGRLQFGGTTSSFPALKRNGTAIETKLADDSAYAPHAMQYLDVTDGITAPAAATGRARIYVDTADGDLKIIFADGTIKTIVVDT